MRVLAWEPRIEYYIAMETSPDTRTTPLEPFSDVEAIDSRLRYDMVIEGLKKAVAQKKVSPEDAHEYAEEYARTYTAN